MARARTAPRKARQTAERQRSLQGRRARADRRRPPQEAEAAMQAGARRYPEPPLPRQHQQKPGRETRLGRAVAVLFAREGADVAIVHLDEAEDAEVTRRAVEAEGRRCLVIQGDVARRAFCFDAVARTVKELGRLDRHYVGSTPAPSLLSRL
jgi:hypothetical protein